VKDSADFDTIVGVGQLALLAVLLMPDASPGSQDSTIDGHGTSTHGPGPDQVEQMPTQTANLRRQRIRDGFQAPLLGATSRETSLLTENLA
jgi:hypothetical protein